MRSANGDGAHGPGDDGRMDETFGDFARGRAGRSVGRFRAEPPSTSGHGGGDADTVDIGELVRSVGRGWRVVCAGALVGLLAAAVLVLALPPRYRATATLLLRNANDPAGSLLSRFGIGGEVAAAAGGGLGNVFRSPMETELRLLASRDVMGEVVDSLHLQLRVVTPRGTPPPRIATGASFPGSFRRFRLDFARGADGRYRVSSNRALAGPVPPAGPGATVRVPNLGELTLAGATLPETFTLQIEDREDAITRLEKRLTVEKLAGEVAKVQYSGADSLSAASVPNALVGVYLQRRRTVDRGMNQRRFEFLATQTDSLGRQLVDAEDALRVRQEATGVFDPELTGQAGAEALQVVEKNLGEADAERVSAARVVQDVERGVITPRQIAAFPTFLQSPAINSLVTQLSQLETERTRLLERRTPRDPEVLALTQSIANVEGQFLPLARSYAASLQRQSAELTRQRAQIGARLAALPAQAESNLRGVREVKRLSQTVLGLNAELIDTRLAALSEGGQVRQVDVARPPKLIWFPRPAPTFAVAALLGLLGGAVAAAGLGAAGPRVVTADDAARASGLPVLRYGADESLLLAAAGAARTLVVVPVGRADDALLLAELMAARAKARGQDAAQVRLDRVPRGPQSPAEARAAVAAAEAGSGGGTVVVAAAGDSLSDPRTFAVLEPPRAVVFAARAGTTRRDALADASEAIGRVGVSILGVVLLDRRGRVTNAPLEAFGRGGSAPNGAPPVGGSLVGRG